MIYFYQIYLLISSLLIKHTLCQDFIQISTNYGDVIGKIHNDSKYSDDKFYSFKGIPYAKPPVDDLLFKCPETSSPWNEPLHALKEGSECPQIDIFGYTGNNDCLYLNIYSPKIPKNDSSNEYLPVMVFIHGGKYIYGSGNAFVYDPSFLVRHNVLIVTLNYRLGAYGFLSLETPEYSGNNGLKDQVLALRWVKENIVYFGGDSNKITLFGESAGASSVHLHLLSPLSQGLFQRAIAQSGSATCDWAMKLNAREIALKLANKLNCTYSNDNEIIKCLKSRTPNEVIEAHGSVAEFDLDILLEFSPAIEPLGSKNPFITEHPLEIMKQGKMSQVPFISGMNSLEGIVLLNFISKEEQINTFNNNMSLPIELVRRYESKEEIETLRKKIKDYYFKGKDYDLTDESSNDMVDFQTDIHFTLCIVESIRFHAKYSSEPVYAYLFDYEGGRNFIKSLAGRTDRKGAAHSDDLFYLFKPHFLLSSNISNKDWVTIDTLSSYWTNFAYNGSPDSKWTPVSAENAKISYLWITSQQENGENSFMKEDLLPSRIDFWNSYFKN